MAGVTGDFGKLAEMQRAMASFSSGAFTRALLPQLAEEAQTQARLGFRGQRDPYGRPWTPLKHRHGQILRDTGRLQNSLSTRVTGDGFVIESNVVYAAVHQYGHTFPARTQVNAHGRSGAFISRARAEARKRGAVAVSIGRIGAVTIPRRQFLPEQDTGGLGEIWGAAFEAVAEAAAALHFGM